MRKKFALNLLFLLAANLLVKPFWIFGIDRVVQNKVGPEEYGTYFAVFNFSFIIGIVLDFGINNFNNRAISRNKNRLGEYLYNLVWLKVGLALVYFLLTFLFALVSGLDAHQLKLLAFLAINQILLSFVLYFRSNVAALQWFKLDAFLSVLDRLLTIVFCLVLLYVSPFSEQFNLFYFIYAQTAALLLTAVFAFTVLLGQSKAIHRRWSWRYSKKILLRSVPFALLALLMGIYYRIDAVMIERLLPDGKTQAGIYAASFRMLDAVNMFGYLFATLLLPMFSKMLREKSDINGLVKLSSELMFAGSTVVAVGCFFFQEPIMHLLYDDANPYWNKIFGWLMLNFIPMSSVYIFGTLLTASGHLRALNWMALSGAVLNVLLNFWLINSYSAFGAVVATLATQVIVALLHIGVAQRHFSLQVNKQDMLKLFSFALLVIATFALANQLITIWWLGLFGGSAVCGFFLLVLRIFRYQDFIALLRVRATS
jgi:O-antigen/teichoic acid export membrane protein